MRVPALAVFVASLPLALVGCSDGGTNVDGSADSSNDATDAVVENDAGPSPCGDSRIDFTYQYPGETTRSACVPVANGVIVNYVRRSDGTCRVNNTSVHGGSMDGRVVQITSLVGRELFASAGSFPVILTFQDSPTCPNDAGACTFGIASDGCEIQVTAPQQIGAPFVDGSLASPCTLTVPGAPGSVLIASMRVHAGPVAADTTDATGGDAGSCP